MDIQFDTYIENHGYKCNKCGAEFKTKKLKCEFCGKLLINIK